MLIRELRRCGGAFRYEHLPPHGDPLLWIADALAWCSSAGGAWRDRVGPMIAASQDVTPT